MPDRSTSYRKKRKLAGQDGQFSEGVEIASFFFFCLYNRSRCSPMLTL
jgi:hypothetical protein